MNVAVRKTTNRRPAQSKISIIDACNDPNLFGSWFQDHKTWEHWFIFMKAQFGLPMLNSEKKIFRQCTSRKIIPTNEFKETWLICGRRSGKSYILALIAVFLATFKDWTPYLSPGEYATILIIAPDRKQARVIFRYVDAYLSRVKLLKNLVKRETSDIFELKRNVAIEIQTASFRTVRGYTVVAALLDEIAFFRSEDSLNPDYEILDAIRPGMLTIPGAMLLCASSPYAKRGALYQTYKDYYGQEDKEVLVWKASTLFMNPSVPRSFIDRAYKRDSASADAEYGANFRTDVENLVQREVVESCTAYGRHEILYQKDKNYVAFVDPSGGSQDSFTLSIGHNEGEIRVIDLIREFVPPFSPDDVVNDIAQTVRSYGLSSVIGDRYGGEWPRERFRVHDIVYKVSEKTKSDIYRDFLPLLNSQQIELLDNERLFNQLISLERRTARGGRDSIDHPKGMRDDVVNSVAGAAVNILGMGLAELW
jgi:hypothetical protein